MNLNSFTVEHYYYQSFAVDASLLPRLSVILYMYNIFYYPSADIHSISPIIFRFVSIGGSRECENKILRVGFEVGIKIFNFSPPLSSYPGISC